MKTFGWLILFAIYTSPLAFILSGCQWKPDAPGNVVHVKTSDFLTPKVKPVSLPVAVKSPDCRCENCECVDCQCKFTPVAVPDPYAPPPRTTLPRSNPPLTNSELLSEGSCANGQCSQGGGEGGGWRPFQRLRGRR